MINHISLAVGGLNPAYFKTESVANQGTYYSEVIITPITRVSGSGGYVTSTNGKPDRYKVVIRVCVNGIWSQDVKIVDDHQARITAKFHGISKFTSDSVMISYNGIRVDENNIVINMINNKRTLEVS